LLAIVSKYPFSTFSKTKRMLSFLWFCCLSPPSAGNLSPGLVLVEKADQLINQGQEEVFSLQITPKRSKTN